ncbi:hypothetical protein MCOR25_002285 [Pyricularia grisea]|nr:hypothetical protein MCOR25_002285 [Pyricularia grisea]
MAKKRSAKGAPNGAPQPAQKRSKSDGPNTAAPSKQQAQQQKAATNKLLADKRLFVQDMKQEDHERERALYKLLSSADVEDRIKASNVIISCLLGSSDENKGVDESVLRRHLERRLFRGLASGSDAARVGFSYVLVELLRQLVGEKNLAESRYPGLGFDVLLEMLVQKTTPVGNVPGQEERDHQWGRLFGLRCFVQADVLFKDKSRWKSVLKMLLQLAKKKAWLQPQCGFVIAQALPLMKRKLAEKTLEEIVEAGMARSPEGLGIWIAAQDIFSDIKLPKPWQDPLSTKSLQDVATVLKGSTQDASEEDGKAAKPSMTLTQLHFAWDLILARFKKQEHKSKDFRTFWDRVVDQSFFSKSATDTQKLVGFKVFQKVLETCQTSPSMISAIFSPHLMTCLMNQASQEGRHNNRAAIKSLKVLESTVEHHPQLLTTILPRLLGENGTYNFDERTNSKTVDKILRFTRFEDGTTVLDLLETLVKESPSSDETEKHLRIYADYVAKLATVGTNLKDSDEQDEGSVGGLALLELAKLAYSSSESGLSEQTRTGLRGRLTTSFAKVIRRPEDFTYLCDAILAVDSAAIDMDEEIQTELADALERLQALVKPASSKRAEALQVPRQGLALLHAIAILQLYNEEPDALEVLTDTKQCYEKLQEKQAASDDGSGLAEFLIEILLSMIAQPSSLMRSASELVFGAFSPFMSAKALELLTDPLAVEENDRGQKTLFNTAEDDEMDIDAEEGSGDEEDLDGLSEIDSDVEFIGMGDAGEDEDDQGSEQNSDDEAGEAGEDDGDENDDALANILGTHRLDKDDEADSDDGDSDMTDSEMMALDGKMAEYFKHRVKKNNKRKDKKDAKESVINFKRRILGLIDVYVKKQAPAGNTVAFELLLPLLHFMRTTSSKELSDKACGVLLDFAKYRKKKNKNSDAEDEEKLDIDQLLERLEGIHEEAAKYPSHAFAKAVSAASLAIATALYSANPKNYKKVARVYEKSRAEWVEGKPIQQSFFGDWNNWCQSISQANAQARQQQQDDDSKAPQA